MARLEPAAIDELPEELRGMPAYARQLMGFVPNDALTMARWPELLAAMQQLVGVIYGPGQLDDGLKRLVALVVSTASGCRYCQAHTAHGAAEGAGVSREKLAAVWEFETSELFDERERAALRVARAAGQHPNAATDADFEALRARFDEREILEIIGIISLFGFLNRWNDTLATRLEPEPLGFAQAHLPDGAWSPGKHAAD